MRIGLLDIDSHNFPNLPLMKISAYHKNLGDEVIMVNKQPFLHYQRVYVSKIFDETYSKEYPYVIDADEIIKGGTGYGLDNKLSQEIEHIMPDYSLYGITNTAYGFLTRGCPNNCPFCIVSKKEGRCSKKVANLSEWHDKQKNIVLLDPNILACKEHPVLLDQLSQSEAKVDFTQGLDARCLNEKNIDQLNKISIKSLHFAWDLMKFEKKVKKGLMHYNEQGKIKNLRQKIVYVLTNFNTTHEEDLYRVYELQKLNYSPYIMVFDKPNAPKITRNLQRWCNNRAIYYTTPNFKDYKF